VANRVDGLLGVLAGDDGAVRFLNVDRCELYELVHPIRPKVLLATGFVVAKDAVWQHTRSILAGCPTQAAVAWVGILIK